MKPARVILSLLCAACLGCGSSSNKPLLPKQPANEAASSEQEEWQRTVEKADIIYFPVETIQASGERRYCRETGAGIARRGHTIFHRLAGD